MSGIMRKHGNPGARQRGVATLLILLLVGLAVVVTALAVAYSLRSNQQRQLATHSVTTAQASAWRGVEFVRDVLEGMVQTDDGKKVLYSLSYGAPPSGGCIPASGEGACGGAFDELPSWDASADWEPGTSSLSSDQVLDLDSQLGFGAAITNVRRADTWHAYEVTVRVTGQAAGSVIEPLATSVLEVVYEVGSTSTSSGTPGTCASQPAAPMVFNGNVNLTGGGTGVVDYAGDYEHILVAGNLSVTGGQSKVSGCVKGTVNITGGGITNGGHIYSESDVTFGGIAFPANTRLWGKAVTLNGGSGGPFASIKAGGFQADIYVGGNKIGEAIVAGTLVPDASITALPRTTGQLVPADNGYPVKLQINKGAADAATYLLDLGAAGVTIASSGAVSGLGAALELLEGEAYPSLASATLTFRATGIHGGGFTQNSGATVNAKEVWAHAVSLLNDSRTYDNVRANGHLDFQYQGVTIGQLEGGGDYWARSGQASGSGFPKVTSGRLAGRLYYGVSKSLYSGPSPTGVNVTTQQVTTSPGLPGLPYCDVRPKPIDAEAFKPDANYIYEVIGGQPQLTIQNVKSKDGVSIDGVYPLTSLSTAQAAVLTALMSCDWGNDKGCTKAWKGSYWELTPQKFPPGVVWFNGPVVVRQNPAVLYNTIVNKGGNVELGEGGGSKSLVAPNMGPVATVCGADYYPANLCDSPTAFATWEDGDGNTHTGMPIGNSAVLTEGGMQAHGWSIKGNVLLGGSISSGGSKVTVQGSVTVGSNQFSDTNINAGGIEVSVPTGSGGFAPLPVCEPPAPVVVGVPTATVRWSRYL
ncbi:hypothetical protein [Pseudoxanthomonas sp.]|uniref:hypothetical protein n=1 Tax=Pseudoxanthomonas sp. TaxID=1871049 RepID=UPI0025843922|nr:hypothetical protein [Pseudoxanthomonas sp.]MCR6685677.1 hypothetical protein [Pseudoxanthomonas sp.]